MADRAKAKKTKKSFGRVKENAITVSEILSINKTEGQGMTQDMQSVRRWNSKDGKVFYPVIGEITGNQNN